MSRRFSSDSDEFDNDFDDHDFDPDGEEPALVPCSSCGASIFDDVDVCPKCGQYIMADTNPWSGQSTWWIILGALGVFATLVALAFG